ncbi:MAG: NAD(P)/FAD-dependent oxidoreductase [Kiritimatiellales bacterium]
MQYDVIIIGGGAAGMFAAAVIAEEAPDVKTLVLEKGRVPLAKVRISGGGRCNLTHRCFDIREFVKNYPRGERELIGPFNRFGPAETIQWFEAHGVPLVTLDDGCIFPRSDSSDDIIDVFMQTVARGAVEVRTESEVQAVEKNAGGFNVTLRTGKTLYCKKLLVATGGGAFIEGLEHTVEPCVPSLFTFTVNDDELTALAGITVEHVAVSAAGFKTDGALLITHSGISGPAVLTLSSFGARIFAAQHYRFEMTVNWLPAASGESAFKMLEEARAASPKKQIGTWSPFGIPARLWKLLAARAGIAETQEWGTCPSKNFRRLIEQLCRFPVSIAGKNPHREEFVTCGGIRLKEINFKTMESRLQSGLYLAGEVLDIDALTGGFNLQAAWTTGWIAAQNMIKR